MKLPIEQLNKEAMEAIAQQVYDLLAPEAPAGWQFFYRAWGQQGWSAGAVIGLHQNQSYYNLAELYARYYRLDSRALVANAKLGLYLYHEYECHPDGAPVLYEVSEESEEVEDLIAHAYAEILEKAIQLVAKLAEARRDL